MKHVLLTVWKNARLAQMTSSKLHVSLRKIALKKSNTNTKIFFDAIFDDVEISSIFVLNQQWYILVQFLKKQVLRLSTLAKRMIQGLK